jgi:Ca-activated chloride channel family protein
MKRKLVIFTLSVVAVSLIGLAVSANRGRVTAPAVPQEGGSGSGALVATGAKGKALGQCPLKHTDVKAEISGFISRVVVTQEFENPYSEKIEAVYTFPLPQRAAVDDMTMRVGDRTVRGKILRREEAQAVYDAARNNGQVTSLLDQERPNIFTQSVANIMPGEKVSVQISYVETLSYEDGSYSFVFPMVVGPRYIPGAPTGQQGGGRAPDTTQVPDASRITPQIAPKGTRAGHDISLEVVIDAGVPVESVRALSHEATVQQLSASRAAVRLTDAETIPNKDFVLKYDVAGKRINDAVLSHRDERGGFFTLILQPPDTIAPADVTPKEIVFVLDTSGSMGGFPIEKAKESMKLALDNLYPNDTFNLITFAGDTSILFDKPVPATRENLAKAQAFLESRTGGGGTEMMTAIRAALEPSDKQDHVRIVCFMTDGYVGNDLEIVGEIQKHPNARVFSFGIGSSVNRYLLDKMAEEGRGEVEYVALTDDGSAAAKRFHERIRNPLLTDISVDWNGLAVADVYPSRIGDLFGAKPVILTGRFKGEGKGVIRLTGKQAGREVVREIPVDFSGNQAQNTVLSTLWARQRVDDLMAQDYAGVQTGHAKPEVKETITQVGLEYRLMTQFTSFVAVEEMVVTDGGVPRRIDVPVELPEGVSREGVLGEEEKNQRTASPTAVGYGMGRGVAGKTGVATRTKDVKAKRADTGSTSLRGANQPRKEADRRRIDIDADESVITRPPTPAEKRHQELIAKAHPSLAAVIERLEAKSIKPTPDESKFVRDGKAEIQIWLTDKSPAALAELQKLGFEVVLDPKTSKMIVGRIAIEKLAALMKLDFVRYVGPQAKL